MSAQLFEKLLLVLGVIATAFVAYWNTHPEPTDSKTSTVVESQPIPNEGNEPAEPINTKYETSDYIDSLGNKINFELCGKTPYNFDIKFTPKTYSNGSNVGNIELSISMKGNFQTSSYLLESVYQNKCIIKGLSYFIQDIKNHQKPESILKVNGVFYGHADVSGGKKYVTIYKGEFGTIVKDNVQLNGQLSNVLLRPNKPITNTQLAFLRAYGMFDTFFSLLRSNDLELQSKSINFIADVGNNVSSRNKFAQIELEVKIENNLK